MSQAPLDGHKGIPVYKCCRCGKGSLDFDAEPVPYTILSVFASGPLISVVGNVPRHNVHWCGDGGVGMTMIVGIEPLDRIEAYRKHRDEQQAEELRQTATGQAKGSAPN